MSGPPPDPSRCPLAELRAQIALGITPALEGRWLRILRYDARSGARDLVSVLERRRADRRREMRRLGRLFALRRTLFAAGIYGIENVDNAGRLPAVGATIIALPMKIKGGSGGPLRIVALLP